jgi:hypothetical protein
VSTDDLGDAPAGLLAGLTHLISELDVVAELVRGGSEDRDEDARDAELSTELGDRMGGPQFLHLPGLLRRQRGP